jgi:hypothetical protein
MKTAKSSPTVSSRWGVLTLTELFIRKPSPLLGGINFQPQARLRLTLFRFSLKTTAEFLVV